MHIKMERRCVACHQNLQQNEMLRVARVNNNFVLDKNHNMQGRGAYICKNKQCIGLAIKKKLLNKAFKTNLSNSIYEELGKYE